MRRSVLAALLLTVAAIGVPTAWTAYAHRERQRVFQAWAAAGVLAQAKAHGVAQAAERRAQWVPYGTSMTIRAPGRSFTHPDTAHPPKVQTLPLDPSLGHACPDANVARMIHRGVDRDGKPVAVVQRDHALAWPVTPWAWGAALAGLLSWLLTSRARPRLAGLALSVGVLTPVVGVGLDAHAQWRGLRMPGNWIGVAHMASHDVARVAAPVGCDLGMTYTATWAAPGSGEAGLWLQRDAPAPKGVLRLSWRRWALGLVLWAAFLLAACGWLVRGRRGGLGGVSRPLATSDS